MFLLARLAEHDPTVTVEHPATPLRFADPGALIGRPVTTSVTGDLDRPAGRLNGDLEGRNRSLGATSRPCGDDEKADDSNKYHLSSHGADLRSASEDQPSAMNNDEAHVTIHVTVTCAVTFRSAVLFDDWDANLKPFVCPRSLRFSCASRFVHGPSTFSTRRPKARTTRSGH
jgi:hypothetical protein